MADIDEALENTKELEKRRLMDREALLEELHEETGREQKLAALLKKRKS